MCIRDSDEKDARVGAAFMQLTRGMQVARPDFETRAHVQAIGGTMAYLLERLSTANALERQKRVEAERCV